MADILFNARSLFDHVNRSYRMPVTMVQTDSTVRLLESLKQISLIGDRMWSFTGKNRPDFAIEPGQGQESVWDYPRPPVCVEDSREVLVRLGDVVIAKSTNAIRVLETASPPTFYLPPTDINFEVLQRTAGNSFCEWKGAATYWSLVSGDSTLKNVGWSYESPSPSFAAIKSYLSFYPAKLECTVAGQPVRPQPGGFYGGWVTDEIIGPYKGEPGTGGW